MRMDKERYLRGLAEEVEGYLNANNFGSFLLRSGYGTGRLSWWSLMVEPGLLWRSEVFIKAPSRLGHATPRGSSLILSIERESRVRVIR